MALRRGFSYSQIKGSPVFQVQAGRVDPLMRTGETSGQVFCPQRQAHIAVMRCGEYQRQFGCGLRSAIDGRPCPNAASEKLIAETKVHARSALEANELYECPVCHDPVENAGRRCKSCGNSHPGRRRRRKVGARFIAPAPACVVCGETKKAAAGTRCRSCASHDTALHRPHGKGSRHNEKFWRGVF